MIRDTGYADRVRTAVYGALLGAQLGEQEGWRRYRLVQKPEVQGTLPLDSAMPCSQQMAAVTRALTKGLKSRSASLEEQTNKFQRLIAEETASIVSCVGSVDQGPDYGMISRSVPLALVGRLVEWIPEKDPNDSGSEHFRSLLSLCLHHGGEATADPGMKMATLLFASQVAIELVDRERGLPLERRIASVENRLARLKVIWQPAVLSAVPDMYEPLQVLLQKFERFALMHGGQPSLSQINSILGKDLGQINTVFFALTLYLDDPAHADDALWQVARKVESASLAASVGAMVGTLLGIRNGRNAFPPEMLSAEDPTILPGVFSLINACTF